MKIKTNIRIFLCLITISCSASAFEKVPSLKALTVTALTKKYVSESANNNDLLEKIVSRDIPQDLKDSLAFEVVSYRILKKTTLDKVDFIHLLLQHQQFEPIYCRLLDRLTLLGIGDVLMVGTKYNPYALRRDYVANKTLCRMLDDKYELVAFEKVLSLKALAVAALTKKYVSESTNNKDLLEKIVLKKISRDLKKSLAFEVVSFRVAKKTDSDKVDFIHLLLQNEKFESVYYRLLDRLTLFGIRNLSKARKYDPYNLYYDYIENKKLCDLLIHKYQLNPRKILESLIRDKYEYCNTFISSFPATINDTATTYDSLTPLHSAVRDNAFTSVKKLLELGALNSIKDPEGKTASQVARERGYTEMADYIENYKHPISKKICLG